MSTRVLRSRKRLARGAWYVATTAVALVFLLPLLVAAFASLKPAAEIALHFLRPPTHLYLGNYEEVFKLEDFGRAWVLSLAVALLSAIVQTALAVTFGYALARLDFRGRRALFRFVLLTMTLPAEVLSIPLFLMAAHFPLVGGNDLVGVGGHGLIGSFPGLLLPYLVSGLGIFLMRQFFLGLPASLEEAARIDGCSEWRIFRTIMLPLVAAPAAVVALLAFQAAWVAFLWPLLVALGPDLYTIQLVINELQQQYSTNWGWITAGAMTASVPIIVLFALIQRHLREGITFTGGVG
jgi:multiple sugar transport system permease protein